MQTARWKARVATGVLSLLVSTGCGCAARLPVATPSLHRQTIAADVVPQPTVSETVFLRTRLDATAKKTPAAAADGGGGGDLSAAAQNPIASNVSLPFENSFMFGAGPDNDAAWVMNIQPVIPVPVGPVNLITRPILPVMYMPGPVTGLPFIDGVPSGEDSADQFGIGDLNVTTFGSQKGRRRGG